ncbi:L,D-transpeptidase family protein [Methylococcus geothermalis]|uniref:L,D-transpeptidase family protein n=1 Tax=Methylococcus geothermalis TaxID=2681310 RepID=A0A858QBN2_9GAMM|nr:L,D-transpeptidase family protein [Methylococcus geothermalis]QJD31114.1 L,D-transpeptidase family protein [Methylococcus geothermalis]
MLPKAAYLLPMTALLLTACAGSNKQAGKPSLAAAAPERTHLPKPALRSAYVPPLFSDTGQRTVSDVLHDFGPYSVRKLKPYFERAGVAYPPREVVLIGLKQEKKLELWARDQNEYRLIRDYDIRAASGSAGPKLRQGDLQVPEGIYQIVGLNPNSHYHLSMKLNYPNDFDLHYAQLEGRTNPGSDIFIHGRAVSAGCLAMGDETIEELFVLAAHVGKENMKVVIAPHDPRAWPLDQTAAGQPEWTRELYATIADEILSISRPLAVSSNRPYSPPYRR